MSIFIQANKALESLTDPGDRYHPGRPKEPRIPLAPSPTLSKFELLSGNPHVDCRTLSTLVDEALKKAGIDSETVPAEMREAFDRTSVEAYRDDRDEPPYLKVDWEIVVPNPEYEAMKAKYDREMTLYKKESAGYVEKVEAWVKERNEFNKFLSEKKDRAEYERLKAKFEKP